MEQHIPAASYVVRGKQAGMRGREDEIQPHVKLVKIYWFPPLHETSGKIEPAWEDPNTLTIVSQATWDAVRRGDQT